jgi:UDP-N-acetylmuramate dehydrogenase
LASEALKEELSILGAKVLLDDPLARRLTMRVGGPAEIYVEVTSVQQLEHVLSVVRKKGLGLFIIGAGSNLLVRESGIKGIILRLKGEYAGIEADVETGALKAGAGVMLPMAVKRSVDMTLSGLETLAGIPGTLGGALAINAGTKWGSVSDNLVYVETADILGKVTRRARSEIKFEYRTSDLEGKIILSAGFALKKSDKKGLEEKINGIIIERSATQPLGTFNAGCIFKNPPGASAGKIIADCGLKNRRIGGARVSDKHANFIINDGAATAADIERLIFEVRRIVAEKTGITLELEIKII